MKSVLLCIYNARSVEKKQTERKVMIGKVENILIYKKTNNIFFKEQSKQKIWNGN